MDGKRYTILNTNFVALWGTEKSKLESRVLRSFHNDEGLSFSSLSHKDLYT